MDWRYGVFCSTLDYTLMAKDYMILILFLFLIIIMAWPFRTWS